MRWPFVRLPHPFQGWRTDLGTSGDRTRQADLAGTERVAIGDLTLSALVTDASFEALAIEHGARLYATFKSSAVHCF